MKIYELILVEFLNSFRPELKEHGKYIYIFFGQQLKLVPIVNKKKKIHSNVHFFQNKANGKA